MKTIKYFFLFMFLSFAMLSCSSDDEIGDVMKRIDPVVDFNMYVGSPSGGKKMQVDNASNATYLYFSDYYNPALYKNMSIEFYGDIVTFIDKDQKKIVSNYVFQQDSLFVYRADGVKLFVARGDTDSLFITESFTRYPSATGNVYLSENPHTTLQKTLAISPYTSLSDMTSVADTIIYSNVTYKFKRR